MPDEDLILVFELSGNELSGGESAEHNQQFYDKITELEEFAQSIGHGLGMSEFTGAVAAGASRTVAFRFPATTAEKFDLKGIEAGRRLSAVEATTALK